MDNEIQASKTEAPKRAEPRRAWRRASEPQLSSPKPAAPDSRRSGFTLVELLVVGAIISIATALALPGTNALFAKQRLRDAAQTVSGVLSYARGEAVSSGNIFIVLIEQDAQGNALVDENGDTVQIQVIDDGRPGSAQQNCAIDTGEVSMSVSLENDVSFGLTDANAAAPADSGGGTLSTGTTFKDADGNDASWVLFRPEGTAMIFSADCSTGAIGSGGGGVYLTDGTRDMAVVLTPLGATRLHSWSDGWTE